MWSTFTFCMLSQKVASCHASKLMSDRMLFSAPPLLSPPLICPLPSDVDQMVLQFSLLATHCSAIATAFWYTSNLITCPLLSKVVASTLACKKKISSTWLSHDRGWETSSYQSEVSKENPTGDERMVWLDTLFRVYQHTCMYPDVSDVMWFWLPTCLLHSTFSTVISGHQWFGFTWVNYAVVVCLVEIDYCCSSSSQQPRKCHLEVAKAWNGSFD